MGKGSVDVGEQQAIISAVPQSHGESGCWVDALPDTIFRRLGHDRVDSDPLRLTVGLLPAWPS